jgi:hypothetical protein
MMIHELWYAAGWAERPTTKNNNKQEETNTADNRNSNELLKPVHAERASTNPAFRYYRRILRGRRIDIRDVIDFYAYRTHLFKNKIKRLIKKYAQ